LAVISNSGHDQRDNNRSDHNAPASIDHFCCSSRLISAQRSVDLNFLFAKGLRRRKRGNSLRAITPDCFRSSVPAADWPTSRIVSLTE
jgi:hypothetical protein